MYQQFEFNDSIATNQTTDVAIDDNHNDNVINHADDAVDDNHDDNVINHVNEAVDLTVDDEIDPDTMADNSFTYTTHQLMVAKLMFMLEERPRICFSTNC